MAERFGPNEVRILPPTSKEGPFKSRIVVDISTEHVDLYIGEGPTETHVRWNRSDGKMSGKVP